MPIQLAHSFCLHGLCEAHILNIFLAHLLTLHPHPRVTDLPGVTALFLLLHFSSHVLLRFLQVSPAATLDKLKESWKLYMEECDRNNSRDPPSTGELNIL